MIYQFNEKVVPELTQVGGKAKALMETQSAGFPVPEGVVLSASDGGFGALICFGASYNN